MKQQGFITAGDNQVALSRTESMKLTINNNYLANMNICEFINYIKQLINLYNK